MILKSWKKLSVSTFQWGGRHNMRTSPRPKWTVLGTTNMEDFISRKTKERLVIIPLKPLDVNVISGEDQLSMEEQLAHASKICQPIAGTDHPSQQVHLKRWICTRGVRRLHTCTMSTKDVRWQTCYEQPRHIIGICFSCRKHCLYPKNGQLFWVLTKKYIYFVVLYRLIYKLLVTLNRYVIWTLMILASIGAYFHIHHTQRTLLHLNRFCCVLAISWFNHCLF